LPLPSAGSIPIEARFADDRFTVFRGGPRFSSLSVVMGR